MPVLSARVRRLVRPVFSVAALGVLVWLLGQIGWGKVAESLARVGAAGAALLVLLGVLENLADAASLRVVLPVRIGLGRLLSYTSAGALANLVIPWEGGEVLKAGLLRQHMTDHQMLQGLVVWNYLLKLSRPIVTLLAVAIGVVAGSLPRWETQVIAGAAVLSFLPLLVMRVVLRLGAASGIARLAIALRVVRKDAGAWLERGRALDRDIRSFARERPRDYVRATTYQVLARIAAWAAYGATMRLTGMPVSFGTVAMVYAALSVVSFVVMAFPAKVGVLEFAGGGVFKFCGLDGGMGVIVIVIMRIKMIVTTGLASAFVGVGPRAAPPRPAPEGEKEPPAGGGR